MKKKIIVSIFTFLSFTSYSQSLSRSVTSQAGGYVEAGNYKLSYTIGEKIVGEKISGTFKLTQGFQQGYIEESTTTPDSSNSNITTTGIDVKYSIFPIPFDEFIIIELQSIEDFKHLNMKIVNQNSKEVFNKTIDFDNSFSLRYNLSHLSSGVYYLNFYKDNKLINSNRIIKQ